MQIELRVAMCVWQLFLLRLAASCFVCGPAWLRLSASRAELRDDVGVAELVQQRAKLRGREATVEAETRRRQDISKRKTEEKERKENKKREGKK
jgi:hypothetical protein